MKSIAQTPALLRDNRGSALIIILIMLAMVGLFVANTSSLFNSVSKSRARDLATSNRDELNSNLRTLAGLPAAVRASLQRAQASSGTTEIEKCLGFGPGKSAAGGTCKKLYLPSLTLAAIPQSALTDGSISPGSRVEFDLYPPNNLVTGLPLAGKMSTSSVPTNADSAMHFTIRGDLCAQCDPNGSNLCAGTSPAAAAMREQCPVVAESYLLIEPAAGQNDCLTVSCRYRVVYRIQQDPQVQSLVTVAGAAPNGSGVSQSAGVSIGSLRPITAMGPVLSTCEVNGVCP